MKNKILRKEDLNDLLKEASRDWDVYVPQKNIDNDIWFEALPKEGAEFDRAAKNIVLDDTDTVISPKDIFFPQLESCFEFVDGLIHETVESSPKLLFGVRACDLKGILFADDFYKRNFQDKYYLSRIKSRLIVVKGCLKAPRETCFCASAKTGPFADGGYDLQLVEFLDFYFVEIGSRKGDEFVKKHEKFFKSPANTVNEDAAQVKLKASESVELKVEFQKALELMAKDNFIPEENYKRIGERCIYCGACVYVCPTCTCFNVFDNVKDKDGQRLRNWDACVFEGYTRETSGHNPRKEKWLRASRRYEHKLKYDYMVTGTSGCVGCGRCLASCPVKIGVSKFIQEITEKRKIM